MIPAFLDPSLARRILLAGKSIVFIRAHGGAMEELPGRAALRAGPAPCREKLTPAAIEAPQHAGLEVAIDAAYRHASSRCAAVSCKQLLCSESGVLYYSAVFRSFFSPL
jgi:hypothetical protein